MRHSPYAGPSEPFRHENRLIDSDATRMLVMRPAKSKKRLMRYYCRVQISIPTNIASSAWRVAAPEESENSSPCILCKMMRRIRGRRVRDVNDCILQITELCEHIQYPMRFYRVSESFPQEMRGIP